MAKRGIIGGVPPLLFTAHLRVVKSGFFKLAKSY